jgi:type 1 fimbria pilin
MRTIKFFAFVLVLLLFSASAVISQGSKAATAKKVTLKGEILDLACYVAGEKKGAEHKKCAEM